ncbi:hypothetical protein BB560_001183, partial [Smittium megazygosporum]
ENLLLDKHRNIKITDFGFANHFDTEHGEMMITSCGSPCYAAPELVVSNGMYHGTRVDIWSCGVILFAMLAGYLPYDDDENNPNGENINMLYKYILSKKLEYPSSINPQARALLERMLVPDPTHRATLEEVRNHPWLSKYRSIFEENGFEMESSQSVLKRNSRSKSGSKRVSGTWFDRFAKRMSMIPQQEPEAQDESTRDLATVINEKDLPQVPPRPQMPPLPPLPAVPAVPPVPPKKPTKDVENTESIDVGFDKSTTIEIDRDEKKPFIVVPCSESTRAIEKQSISDSLSTASKRKTRAQVNSHRKSLKPVESIIKWFTFRPRNMQYYKITSVPSNKNLVFGGSHGSLVNKLYSAAEKLGLEAKPVIQNSPSPPSVKQASTQTINKVVYSRPKLVVHTFNTTESNFSSQPSSKISATFTYRISESLFGCFQTIKRSLTIRKSNRKSAMHIFKALGDTQSQQDIPAAYLGISDTAKVKLAVRINKIENSENWWLEFIKIKGPQPSFVHVVSRLVDNIRSEKVD